MGRGDHSKSYLLWGLRRSIGMTSTELLACPITCIRIVVAVVALIKFVGDRWPCIPLQWLMIS